MQKIVGIRFGEDASFSMASARKKVWIRFRVGFVTFDGVSAYGITYKNAQSVLRCSQKAEQMADQVRVFFIQPLAVIDEHVANV